MDWRPNAENDRLALAILAGFLVARLVFAFSLGLGIDESYTIAISRRLSLSYFDHPPLHLWIAHFAALAVGENVAARAPFAALFFATGWIFYRLTSGLFDPQAALIALFALNVTPFFFASAGSWIVPDGPLLFGLALAAFAAARLFFASPQDEASAWRLWLVVGVGLGLAGLSKYSAALTAGGLAAFVLIARNQRHWLKHPAPYAAAIVALAMITPVIVWNAQHGWASFAFQGGRGVPEGGLRPAQFMTMVLGQIAFLSPWIFAPLVAGLASAWRQRADERRLFLLCLSLPPIALFTVTPLWGGRGQPHWTMPGWFFAFALMGMWLKQFGVSAGALRRWAVVSSVLLAAIAGAAILQASTGWPWLALTAGSGLADPMLEAFEWRDLRKAPIFDAAAQLRHRHEMVGRGKDRARPWTSDPRFRAFKRSARLGVPGREREFRRAERSHCDASRRPQVRSWRRRALFRRAGTTPVPNARSWRPRRGQLALIPAGGLTRRLPMSYPGATGR